MPDAVVAPRPELTAEERELVAQAERIARGEGLIVLEASHVRALLRQRELLAADRADKLARLQETARVLIAWMLHTRAHTLQIPDTVIERLALDGLDVQIHHDEQASKRLVRLLAPLPRPAGAVN